MSTIYYNDLILCISKCDEIKNVYRAVGVLKNMLLTCPAICLVTLHMHSERRIVKPMGSIMLIPKPATRHNSYFERLYYFIKKVKLSL
jgi:hypothetical protein